MFSLFFNKNMFVVSNFDMWALTAALASSHVILFRSKEVVIELMVLIWSSIESTGGESRVPQKIIPTIINKTKITIYISYPFYIYK